MDFKDVIIQRRSVNFFDSAKDVPDALLREMTDLAAKAPSGFNLQPWSLIILKDKKEKLQLQKLAWNQPKVSEAPVILILLADRDAWKKDHPFLERNFREMVNAGSMKQEQYGWFTDVCKNLYGSTPERQQAFACKNTGFFAMSLMLAAKHLGLDTHPMDGFDHDGVRKAFNIPENYWVPLLIAVGCFQQDKELSPPKWRKTFDEIVVKFH